MSYTLYALLAAGGISLELLWRKLKKANSSKNLSGSALTKAKNGADEDCPSNRQFPKNAEVYQALEDLEVSYLTHHFAPYTGGGKLKLKQGEKIIVSEPSSSQARGIYCQAFNYEKAEILIPKEERDQGNYAGYSLYLETSVINQKFKPVDLKPIHYTLGDATKPKTAGTKIIVHICNDAGGWGKGFVVAISNKWKAPEEAYRAWFKHKEMAATDTIQFERIETYDRYSDEKKFALGNVQFVQVEADLWVANIIAQTGMKPNKEGTPPIRYLYVKEGLNRVQQFAEKRKASVHMPRIGCGLAGGKWSEIEPLIQQHLIAYDVETTVYDFV